MNPIGDGDEGIHLFLAEPPRPQPDPTIVLVHGGPDARDRDEFEV